MTTELDVDKGYKKERTIARQQSENWKETPT